MTDRRASLDSHPRRLQRRSPAPEAPPLHSGSLHSISAPRRRSVRAASIPNDSTDLAASPWVDANRGEHRKAKGASWKAHGVRSRSNSTSPAQEADPPEEEEDTGLFLPKLSRIPEGQETRISSRRRSLPAGSRTASVPSPQYQAPTQAAATTPRTIRRKQGSLQRLAEGGVDLSNPSLVSIASGRTQQSSPSSGSNSTVTQRPPSRTQSFKQRAEKELRRLRGHPTQTETMSNPASSVFQYMNEELVSDQFLNGEPHKDRPASSSSSTVSANTNQPDGESSDSQGSPPESPMTSPASVRIPNASALGSLGRWNNSGHQYAPLTNDSDSSDDESELARENSTAPNQPSVQEESEEEEEEEDPSEEHGAEMESQTGEVEDANTDDETTDSGAGVDEAPPDAEPRDTSPTNTEHLTVERIPPPRLPSTSSSHYSDRHTRRLRAQEQALRDHVLQSPQPHRGFDFAHGVSPSPHPAMMYDSYSNSDGPPASMYVPAPQPPTWPTPAPIPPMGYYSPTHAPPAPPAHHGFSPENSYAMTTRPPVAPPSALAHHPPSYGHPHPPYYQQQETAGDVAKTTVVGYELLADKLTELSHNEKGEQAEGQILPMYRKFEQLNHRVLLHLQDEISELEEELRYLDECIARASPPEETHHRHTASRRNEARYGGELHYRRTELLGRVYLKLGQYNQALSSFSHMLKDLDSPDADQVQVYRSWMERHTPIERSEAQFLERKHDLVAVPRRGSATTVGGVNTHQSVAVGLPLIALIPLMLFAIIPGFLGRLFIIAVIGAAEVSVVTSTELMDLMAIREWVICASGYFGLMAILAGLVH